LEANPKQSFGRNDTQRFTLESDNNRVAFAPVSGLKRNETTHLSQLRFIPGSDMWDIFNDLHQFLRGTITDRSWRSSTAMARFRMGIP